MLAGCGAMGVAVAADATVVTHDTLAYKDGDRVHGRYIGRDGEFIVFKADRFGELRVLATDAVVIPADKPVAAKPAAAVAAVPAPPAAAPAATTPAKAAANVAEANKKAKDAADEKEEEERVTIWERFSPLVLTAKVRKFFGPYHGRLALSTEVVSDTTDRNNIAVDATLKRKWASDEMQLNGRFDYSETNKTATTDVIKGSGLYRHDFSKKVFGQYRPTLEWNRASTLAGQPNDYLLLQQEIGVGFNLINTPARKLRTGLSENLFDVWNTSPTSSHSSRGVSSVFEEVEWTLPWRMTLTQRGVYYPVPGRPDGWENKIELVKKLTETLSTSLRHEIRRDNPDGSAQDYTRLKLLFGLDF